MSCWWIRCGCLGSWGQVDWGLDVVEFIYLFRTRYVRYFMAIWSVCFMSFLTFLGGILGFSRASSDCLCTAPYASTMMVIRRLTFHPAIFNIRMRGVIFVCLFFSYGNIWENIMAIGDFYVFHGVWWIWGDGGMGVWLSIGTPSRHNMLGLSQAMRVHCINQSVMVMSWG